MPAINSNNDGRMAPNQIAEDRIKFRPKPVDGENVQVAGSHVKDHVYLFNTNTPLF